MDKYIVLVSLAVLILLLAGFYLYGVSKKPKEEQIEELEKFLRYLVYEAEKYFGSKTGQLKLAYVYNMAVKQFPWIAYVMTYEEFDEKFVKAALEWLKKQLSENPRIQEVLDGSITSETD